jgi:hypothetical protein
MVKIFERYLEDVSKMQRKAQELNFLFDFPISRNINTIPKENAQGVVAYSPLVELPAPFSLITDVPPEEFHLIKEGVGRLMFKRFFEESKRKKNAELLESWNELYLSTRLLSEMTRRSRRILISQLKGQCRLDTSCYCFYECFCEHVLKCISIHFSGNELGVLIMGTIPSLVSFMADNDDDAWQEARRAFAIFCFIVRAYNLSDEELQAIEERLRQHNTSFERLHEKFYKAFEEGFCELARQNPTINVHVFSHLYDIRKKTGPLYQYSAEPFESLYAVMRRSYCPGTRNVPKQAMENVYLRIMYTAFHGKPLSWKMKPYSHPNTRTDDSLALLQDGRLACVTEIEGKVMRGSYLRVASTHLGLRDLVLPWELVGCWKFERVLNTSITFTKKDIKAKAMRVGDFIISWPMEWLMSKRDD